MTLIVCGLAEVPGLIAARAPSHVITLLDAASMIPTPDGLSPDRHLKLSVNDIAEPTEGLILPSDDLVRRLLAFGRTWDETAPMIVHCWAGISRSSASAFVLACDRNPSVDERAIALTMRQAAKHAYPNRRIVALADDVLGRRGRMVEAVEAMGDYEYSGVGVPFDFAVRY
ncbi:tyrosine phosphatase family protein [Phenylobacterium sp. Root700]|uniref:tyrosine phosphatase family protein n=1 Tax=Phenylobacterium sp. Root700 TaxID=1736591 RepID=UPI0006F34FF3|nr:hypothetical protein [Phenylobacterium sp. Root700]KRB40000.1 hypothetical protein ASE02_09405 [Phenylobacterium sp. Root700]